MIHFYNPSPLDILFAITIWIGTTFLFTWVIRRHNKISETAQMLWSIIVVFTWIYGVLLFLIWQLAWRVTAPATDKAPKE